MEIAFRVFAKSSYVLGSEAWEEYSSGLLSFKDFVLSVWEEMKVGEHSRFKLVDFLKSLLFRVIVRKSQYAN